jgi:hypothetical protein
MSRVTGLALLFFLSTTLSVIAGDPVYDAVRSSRPDSRTIAVSNMTFEQDVYRFTLNGTFHLLQPAGGKTFGAVFTGTGSWELDPASPHERRQLAIYAADDKLVKLSDQFESGVFFSAQLVDALEKTGTKSEAESARAKEVYDTYLKRQRKDLKTNIHSRVAQDLLNGGDPLFFAYINGRKLPPAVLAVDPLGVDALRISSIDDAGEQTTLYVDDREKGGFWYMSRLRSEVQTRRGVIVPPLTDAESYEIDTNVISRDEIEGTTIIAFTTNHANLRLLPVSLMSRLRVREAVFATAAEPDKWMPLEVIQENEKEDADFAVIFPAALPANAKYRLKVTYKGKDVLQDAGDGNYSVGARTSWYPNLGTFSDLAQYRLTFRVPQKMQVIAVGRMAEEKVLGEQRVSIWTTEQPVRVAGFNYGKFKKLSNTDKDSGVTVDVYTNPGTPNVINEINAFLTLLSETEGGPSFVRVDTGRLAQAAMADGVNTARTGNYYFGALPNKHVAITQQSQWSFGQSWPSLIYMPYIAFLSGTTRNTLGMNDAKDFVDQVGPHEFAHQWWGHHVGWYSYRDQWLSEGLSEFTAALVLQQSGGWPKYNELLEKARRFILEKPRGAMITNAEAGPITQGMRVATWRNGSAYSALTYSKGAYVVHMLRMAMQDPSNQKAPDARFAAMMTDFATTYAGKNPSTRDFQQIAEKHAPQSMRLTEDGKLDWFFNQWVYGTSIPRYETKLSVTDIGGGKYRIAGTIAQSMVEDDFVGVVPIYVNFDKGAMARLASAPIAGNNTREISFEVALPRVPKSVTINNNHDILAR